MKFFNRLTNFVAGADPFSIIGLLTCLVLLFNSHGQWFALLAVVALAALSLRPSLRRNPIFWLLLVLIWIPRLVIDWRNNEDHIFFGIYWCMALSLAFWGDKPAEAIRFNARCLIGLSFLIATIWKLISPQFYEGELFHYKLLQDHRFRAMVTTTIGGLDIAADAQNAQAIKDLKSGASYYDEVSLKYPVQVSWIAYVMTYWTILIEGALGLLFLLGTSKLLNLVRNGLLMIFAITTYAIVPVLGFGVLFMTMGFANCEPNENRTKLCYLLTTGFILCSFAVRIFVIQSAAT